jgi:hypothetical protein
MSDEQDIDVGAILQQQPKVQAALAEYHTAGAEAREAGVDPGELQQIESMIAGEGEEVEDDIGHRFDYYLTVLDQTTTELDRLRALAEEAAENERRREGRPNRGMPG